MQRLRTAKVIVVVMSKAKHSRTGLLRGRASRQKALPCADELRFFFLGMQYISELLEAKARSKSAKQDLPYELGALAGIHLIIHWAPHYCDGKDSIAECRSRRSDGMQYLTTPIILRRILCRRLNHESEASMGRIDETRSQ